MKVIPFSPKPRSQQQKSSHQGFSIFRGAGGLQKRSNTLTVIPEAPSRGNALGNGLCKGGRLKQIGQGKLKGRSPGGQRYHGLAAWLHRTTGMASAVPAQSVAWGLGQKPFPARPRFPSLQGTLISVHPLLHRQPQFPSHITLATRST